MAAVASQALRRLTIRRKSTSEQAVPNGSIFVDASPSKSPRDGERSFVQSILGSSSAGSSPVIRETSFDEFHDLRIRDLRPEHLRPLRLLHESRGKFSSMLLCVSQNDTEHDELIACKIIDKESLTGNDAMWLQAEAEAKALRAISENHPAHPYLVQFRAAFQTRQLAVLCTNYEAGGTLTDLFLKKVLSDVQVKIIGKHIALGLIALHELGVVHRDVKPDNVLISQDGSRAILCDFGLCKFLPIVRRSSSITSSLFTASSPRGNRSSKHSSSSLSPRGEQAIISPRSRTISSTKWGQTSTRVGTVNFMSPEQIEGAEYGLAVDAWALGCVVYFMASKGKLPFEASSVPLVMDAVLRNKPDYKLLADDDAFEFCSRLFVTDPKRRLELGSSEFAAHGFVRATPDFAVLNLGGLDRGELNTRPQDDVDRRFLHVSAIAKAQETNGTDLDGFESHEQASLSHLVDFQLL